MRRHVKNKSTPMVEWIRKLSEKKPFRLVSVALDENSPGSRGSC